MNTKNDSLSDTQVVALVLAGDIDSYSQIVERYENKLMRYAMYLVKDYDSAADVTQETFIKAYINLRSFKPGKSFSPWIYRILHNTAMNQIKKNKNLVALDDINETDDGFVVNFTSDSMVDQKILGADVRRCLSKIDLKYQEVLVLNFSGNLKYDEISDVLQIPTSTVGVRISRGKAILRQICQNDGVNNDK